MKIAVVGGGPAGLYFSLLMKKADPSHDVTIFERNAPDATFGWGVVFSEETLGALRDADRASFDRITEAWARWSAIDVKYRGETIRSRGHVFSGIARKRLLQILQERCVEFGVRLEFHHEVEDVDALAREHDLVVGADGVNSLARRRRESTFGVEELVHATKFAWFGTDLAFKAFTFIFRENEHGLFQVHAYPFDARMSTFIVECPVEVWRRAGLDQATEDESIRYCEKLFADDLAGHSLLSNRSIWVSFVTLRNQTWHDGNVALLGDAAHTAHFTIGSGTKLAMEDAISLAEWLQRWPDDPQGALTYYEMDRQPIVERFQEAALESARYFENVRRYSRLEPIQFAFNLLTRSGRITHLELEKRDPRFIAMVDSWFAGKPEGSIAPPPMLVPLRLRDVTLPNRVVRWPVSEDDAVDGVPSEGLAERLADAARSGAALVLTEMVAVAPAGRITPGTPGLWREDQAESWRGMVDRIHSETDARVAVLLGHAGPRGACRPRREGVDRPLREGGWEIVAPSPIAYAPWSRVPKRLDAAGMDAILQGFRHATELSDQAGFDMVELQMGHGYLLGSFLSPLTNPEEDRLGFLLEVTRVVRQAWPRGRPVGAALNGADWAGGGATEDDAVGLAQSLGQAGCDLIHVLAGQTICFDRPDYGRMAVVALSDSVRNRAGLPTLVGGDIRTLDHSNTIVAAARSDCTVLLPPQ